MADRMSIWLKNAVKILGMDKPPPLPTPVPSPSAPPSFWQTIMGNNPHGLSWKELLKVPFFGEPENIPNVVGGKRFEIPFIPKGFPTARNSYIGIVPKSHHDKIRTHYDEEGRGAVMNLRDINKPGVGGSLGWYTGRDPRNHEQGSVLRHELGHGAWLNLDPSTERQLWSNIAERSVNYKTELYQSDPYAVNYPKANPQNFADAFRDYLLRPAVLLKEDPEVFAFLDKIAKREPKE